MISTTESLQKLEELTTHYVEELHQYELEELRRKPDEEQWSLGQMILHLTNTALRTQIPNIKTCLAADQGGAAAAGEKTEAGQMLFGQGGFPNTRIRIEGNPGHTPPQPESKEQLIQGLQEVANGMKELLPLLEKASLASTVSHGRFGALQAVEWFLLVEMHYRHHLKQKDRIKAFLAGSV
ncbi:DinB family protein [Paenibacillus turpanensis]|uniref:DinB family protein n=1 Tax=Paenibacillus turpanensis TaxID=2689078 RepID=UPI001A9E8345|nr:DinB family protein [Paenibacillus turpanensis]